ncbi:hypothetical protein LT493_39755 [Streptomyces tricolor]|nr:hypothetical protein [Streptomyces tricolor]
MLFHLAELSAAQYAWLDHHRIPYVLIDPAHEPPAGVVSVGAANWQGGVSATEHLLGLGLRADRGDRRAPARHGRRRAGGRLPLGARRLRACGTAPSMCGTRAVTDHRPALRTHELLDLPEPPTAVFVCADRMALGVYAALAERGCGCRTR